jgi:hypothetical protein
MNARGKLLVLWGLALAGLLVALGVIAAQMFLPRNPGRALIVGGEQLPVGAVALYECDSGTAQCVRAQGSAINFEAFAKAAQSGTVAEYALVWVTHPGAGDWRVFSSVSTHRRCFVHWNAERVRFEDPCGGARWEPDGAYQEGPAPRNLDTFPAVTEDGQLFIELRVVRGASHD